ncbi:MAG: HAD-IIB family hydrolase [Phycisphaerales bacterium]|nr:HAD-IIB family hydrolase [Phycisphaerales bacterium]
MASSYRLLAIDLDGTLLDPGGVLSNANRDAVARAVEAGIEVVVCTGRGLAECSHVIEQLDLAGAAVVAGGAMTVELPSRRTVHRSAMPGDLVRDLSRILNDATGHYVLLLKDRSSTGVDYVLLGNGKVDAASEWWFRQVPVIVTRAERFEDDPYPDETVRLGIVTTAREMKKLGARVVQDFARRTFVHHFPVISADGNGRHLHDDAIHLMEIFNAQTNKWAAIAALAADRGLTPAQVAAIGDEINDVAMIRHAGLGIAMGNAIDPIKQVADRVTLPQEQDGVAHAIEQILAGAW